MDSINALQLAGGLILILWGIININPNLYSQLIKFRNEAKGSKTNITTKTLIVGKAMGYGLILVGIIIIIFSFINS